MRWSRDFLLARFAARDARYDGRFLAGVLSTGIYCRPSCPAKRPRAENVRFFATAEEARAAGLRACKRCRPERAGSAASEEQELADELVEELRARPGELADVPALAKRAGLGLTALARAIRRHQHTTPAVLLERARVDFARRELARSDRRVLDVALDAGFGSSSTFHEAFLARTRTTPATFRRLLRDERFELALPEDFRPQDTLRSLLRADDGPCERRRGARFAKAFERASGTALLQIELGARRARCSVESDARLAPADMLHAHELALRLLGLELDPAPFERRVSRARDLRSLVRGREGLRIPQVASAWEGLAWAILGQQVNLTFADSCRAALVELAGARAPAELRAFPSAARVAELERSQLLRLRLSGRKADTLLACARAEVAGELELESLRWRSAVRAEQRLLALHGIGPWSAHYVLMRALAREDCVPVGDSALGAALQRFFELEERPSAELTQELMAPFAPHRSLATYHLWKSLSEPA